MFHGVVGSGGNVCCIPKNSSSPLELKRTSWKAGLQERINERKMSETISFLNIKRYNVAYSGLLLAHLFLVLWGDESPLQSSLDKR